MAIRQTRAPCWASFLYGRYHLLFLDFRAMGRSEGNFVSFGYYERKDILAAIEELQRRGFHRIGLVGVSFGAAVALLTLPETSALSAVVADSHWADLDAMAEAYYGRMAVLSRPLTMLTRLWARLFYGVITERIAPELAVRGTRTPLLLLASRDDQLGVVQHVYRLQAALRDHPHALVWIRERGGISGAEGLRNSSASCGSSEGTWPLYSAILHDLRAVALQGERTTMANE
jgi:pimeloyl-ACP methyl ester carboxylesterase